MASFLFIFMLMSQGIFIDFKEMRCGFYFSSYLTEFLRRQSTLTSFEKSDAWKDRFFYDLCAMIESVAVFLAEPIHKIPPSYLSIYMPVGRFQSRHRSQQR